MYISKIFAVLSFLLVAIFFFSDSIAQTYNMEYVANSKYFDQLTITTINQDASGFIWVGTTSGLYRYDGKKFKTFKYDPTDTTSIGSDFVVDIEEDRLGRLWIVSFDGGISLFFPSQEKFVRFKVGAANSKKLLDNSFFHIYIDSKDRIWISTATKGLLKITEPVFGSCDFNFTHYRNNSDNKNSLSSNSPNCVVEDVNGDIWITTKEDGLNKLLSDEGEGSFRRFKNNSMDINSLAENDLRTIINDPSGNLIIGTNSKGLVILPNQYLSNPKFTSFNIYKNSKYYSRRYEYHHAIKYDDAGNLWIGMKSGIGKANYVNGELKFKVFDFSELGADDIYDTSIETLFIDRTGVLWIGLWESGLYKINLQKKKFVNLNNTSQKKILSSDNIACILEDSRGSLWIGHEYGEGITKIENYRNENKAKSYFIKSLGRSIGNQSPNTVISLMEDNGDIIAGTYQGGLYILPKAVFAKGIPEKNILNYRCVSDDTTTISSDFVRVIYKTRDGKIWTGNSGSGGLNLFQKETGTFERYYFEGHNKNSTANIITAIYEDSRNNLWVGSWGAGLHKYDREKKEFTTFRTEQNNEHSINNNFITAISEGDHGILWISTLGGLNALNVSTRMFSRFVFKFEGQNVPVYSSLHDDLDNLWLSSTNGIIRFNKKNQLYQTFDERDGVINTIFRLESYFKNNSGEMFFGSAQGVTYFDPKEIRSINSAPDIIMTDLKLMNKSVKIGDKYNDNIVISKNIIQSDSVTLSYKDQLITFEFAAMRFNSSGKISYKYMMEGLDKKWNYSGNNGSAVYTNMPAGSYTFRVEASNEDNVWSENALSITVIVTPPFYETLWFRVLVGISIVMVILGLIKLRTRKLRNDKVLLEGKVQERTNELEYMNKKLEDANHEYEQTNKMLENANNELEVLNNELEQRVEERTSELLIAKNKAEKADKLKTEFLAQISHEIRTPINVILSYTNLMFESMPDDILEENYEIRDGVRRAGDRIIRTIDSILNMSELQVGSYEYKPHEFDLCVEIKNKIFEDYKYLAKEKGLQAEFINTADYCRVYADEYSVLQIISNLVDNAIKYTTFGMIEIKTLNMNEMLVIEVLDTGMGISDEFLPNIFEPFRQEEQGYTRRFEGNGLGLALVKQYCTLNQIQISVESKKDEGTKFTLMMEYVKEERR